MIHGPEHPLVVRLLYEDPVTADTIRGVVSKSLLHRHADVNSVIKNKTELCRFRGDAVYFPLLPIAWNTFSVRDPAVKWECSSHWFSSWTQLLLPFFLPFSTCCLWNSLLLFFHQLLQNACLQATMLEAVTLHTVVCVEREGEDFPHDLALLGTPQPHPLNHTSPKTLTKHRTKTNVCIVYTQMQRYTLHWPVTLRYCTSFKP